MKRSLSFCLSAFLSIAVVAPKAHASSRQQREHGAELFSSGGCLHCHMMGNTGANKGPNLSGVGRRLKPAAMRKQITEGGKGMPPFGDVLKPQELNDLIAYLRSCRAKTSK